MNNYLNRSLDHLCVNDDKTAVFTTFKAVQDLFSSDWLNRSDGHRLQILWARNDYLSSAELYSFGKSINRLLPNCFTWLQSTAIEIKKNKETSHGPLMDLSRRLLL